jgi:glucose-1-phosphate cytidylyltransferase
MGKSMKVVILAGGFGTRLSEETQLRPKPLVEIGQMPIIWHIMKHYSTFGFNDFVICAGYKGYLLKEFFANYSLHRSNMTFNLKGNGILVENDSIEPWQVQIVDTGLDSNTGERLRRIKQYLDPDEDFFFTYGDGLSDVNIDQVLQFHQEHQQLVTMTVVNPLSRYGAVEMDGNIVSVFQEKPQNTDSFVNGGFFVVNGQVFKHIEKENSSWENDVLPVLVKSKQVYAFKHLGFWHSMDTLRDKNSLEGMWSTGSPAWKTWTD